MPLSSCRLEERVLVEVFGGVALLRYVGERALDLFGVVIEAFAGVEGRAGWPAGPAADRFLGLDDESHTFGCHIEMLFMPREGRGVGCAFGGSQDGELRLRDAVSLLVDPGQSVVALPGSQVNERALGLLDRRLGGAAWSTPRSAWPG